MRLCHAIKALTDSAVPTAPLRYPSRAVASPPWVLEHHPLLHLRHGSPTAGRAATRARRAVTAPVCARAPRRAVAGHAGRGRPSKPWVTCAVHTGRAGAVDVGHALLCNWAEHGFGPVAVELFFSIFRIYSNSCKCKNLCRIHLNSENYETNFV
jgi:hypothetical protein